MIHSDRIQQLMLREGLSQSELARRVGVTQGAIAKIARNNPNGTSHLHRIARELRTTPAYLTGEADDPDEGAPLRMPEPPPSIYLRVELPTEEALAEMFEALLDGIDGVASRSEQARLLARRLPIGLAQLHGARPASTRKHRRLVEDEGAGEAASTRLPGLRT